MTYLPPSERVPGVYQRHNHVRGQGRTLPTRVVLVGARASGASSTYDARPVRIRNRSESQTLFHAGSMLDLMLRMALMSGQLARQDRIPGGTPELYCMPIAPVSGDGTAKATQLLTVEGTATNASAVTLHIQDMAIRVPIGKGDSANAIAARLAEYAKRFESDSAYIASADNAVLTMTAREAGMWGQQLYLGLDTGEVGGITAKVARGDTGAGELDISAARTALLTVDWSGVCFPGSEPAMSGVISQYADDAWHYAHGHAPLTITGCHGNQVDALAAALKYNHRHVVMTWAEHVPEGSDIGVWSSRLSARSHDFEVAAAVAARLFSQTKENTNYNKASLPCFGRSENIDHAVLNEAIAGGVTVVLQPLFGGDAARIVDPVTTISKDKNGAPDTEWQPVECVRVKADITRKLAAELAGFPTMDGDADTRASAISAALAVLRTAAKRKLISAPEDDDVTAEYQTVNGAKRLIVELSYGVIVGLDIVEVTHNISRA